MVYSEKLAFVDESGDPNLDTSLEGTTKLYSTTSIVVDASDYDFVKQGVEAVEQEFFSGQLMKSSSVGSNHFRRIKILIALTELPFSSTVLVVNKDRLNRSGGLSYKRSFRKYFASKLCENVNKNHGLTSISLDQVGDEEFKHEFTVYLQKDYSRNLFGGIESIGLVSSSTEPLIRLADFITGSYRVLIERSVESDSTDAQLIYLRELLRKNEVSLQVFPPFDRRPVEHSLFVDSKTDELIRNMNFDMGWKYVEQNSKNPDPNVQMRLHMLKFMLDEQTFEISKSFYSSRFLISFLVDQGFTLESEREFRQQVVAGIRDEGIILTGDSKGLRLASDFQDVVEFATYWKSMIIPMVTRVARARDSIRQLTGVDPLADSNLGPILNLVNAYTDYSLKSGS